MTLKNWQYNFELFQRLIKLIEQTWLIRKWCIKTTFLRETSGRVCVISSVSVVGAPIGIAGASLSKKWK